GSLTKQLVLTLGETADWYSFTVPVGLPPVRISTTTPADGSGQFDNTLDPHIQLFDSTGTTLLASGVVQADGRNEVIAYQPLTAGTYKTKVTAAAGTGGEYVLNVDKPPKANDDPASTTEDNAVTVNVLANDTDPDNDPLSVTGKTNPAHGAVVINANN